MERNTDNLGQTTVKLQWRQHQRGTVLGIQFDRCLIDDTLGGFVHYTLRGYSTDTRLKWLWRGPVIVLQGDLVVVSRALQHVREPLLVDGDQVIVCVSYDREVMFVPWWRGRELGGGCGEAG
jgi:hypothetical protein